MAADRFTCTPGRVAAWYDNCAIYVAVDTVVLGKFQAAFLSSLTILLLRTTEYNGGCCGSFTASDLKGERLIHLSGRGLAFHTHCNVGTC